jgi:hypothetical protein
MAVIKESLRLFQPAAEGSMRALGAEAEVGPLFGGGGVGEEGAEGDEGQGREK